MKTFLIDGTGLNFGRLASFCAKEAIKGNRVYVLNSEKIELSGTLKGNLSKFKQRVEAAKKGNPEKTVKQPRRADMLFRYSVRGMLPWKSIRGKEAYKRIMAYLGVPDEFQGKEFYDVSKLKLINQSEKRISVKELSEALGYKMEA